MSTALPDRWFLSRNNDVVKMHYAILQNDKVFLYGTSLKELKFFLRHPFNCLIWTFIHLPVNKIYQAYLHRMISNANLLQLNIKMKPLLYLWCILYKINSWKKRKGEKKNKQIYTRKYYFITYFANKTT